MSRVIRIGISIVLVVVIFFFALPKIADFSQVWAEMKEMTWLELSTLLFMSLWNIVTYWFVMMAGLPGSNFWQTMKVNQASTAVSNTLPGGGAIGIGVTYGMYSNYGFKKQDISLQILVTGIWNNFVKLGMPVIALALLALEGSASGGLVVASIVGLAVLVGAIAAFAAILSSERLALTVGRKLQSIVNGIRKVARREPITSLAEATVRFRTDAIELIGKRWLRLTVSTVVSHLSLFFVLLLALRHVGVSQQEVSTPAALAAFAFVRLISAIPITPGGLGVVELGATAALVAAGGNEAQVVAAVLIYRALTYLLPIPLGLAAYLKWRHRSGVRRERLQAEAAQTGVGGGKP